MGTVKLNSIYNGVVMILILFIAGCGPANEKAHPLFRKGEHCVNNCEYKAAVDNFEKYLKVNPDSSLAHYKLAVLYNDNLDDPFYAVYHFREFLKLKPDFSDSELVQSWIDAAEIKLAERIRERDPNSVSAEDLEQLKMYNAKYRDALVKLKDKNAMLLKKLHSSVISTSAVAKSSGSKKNKTDRKTVVLDESGAPVIVQTYTVKQGDNLSRISRDVYGSSKYYKAIFNANRDTMKTEASLKIGQELRIPQLKK